MSHDPRIARIGKALSDEGAGAVAEWDAAALDQQAIAVAGVESAWPVAIVGPVRPAG
jgi:hypothetical protein